MPSVTLDARNLLCPLPLLKAKLCLRNMLKGEVLKIYFSDATSAKELRLFAQANGHQYYEPNDLPCAIDTNKQLAHTKDRVFWLIKSA